MARQQHRHRNIKNTQFLFTPVALPSSRRRHEFGVVEGGFFMVFVVACVRRQHLVVTDAGGLHALLALLGDEGDNLALLEGLEAVLL